MLQEHCFSNISALPFSEHVEYDTEGSDHVFGSWVGVMVGMYSTTSRSGHHLADYQHTRSSRYLTHFQTDYKYNQSHCLIDRLVHSNHYNVAGKRRVWLC